MGRIWIALLSVILLVWFPLNFAAELLQTVPSLDMRGPVAALELFAHGLVTSTCVAAGWSLWISSAHGPLLARIALVAAAASAVQSLFWSVLPSQTMPGDEWPLALIAVAHSGVWLVYLNRSARIRAMAA